ncbi:Uncharacterized damage-inducible protein DinB (forms a four-helix bundle) [Granulicella rosea]|uniref:Uncharacterized damage-inducible protein DinB (Forms a four-helix bundle) n=1 Tax=Granulicella rosea TaxID=474952 RepID=A0A239HYT1_9BACT|nr:DinB family protein [Granulicella rosea]SNS85863.1 Uncharacterized damage-inducible protein DinB (forms a four-helix bundle) [Granulicella rosea]
MTTETLVSADALLEGWQAHRRLTRRTIEAFPEDKLFEFSIGGMRSFAAMALEMIGMAMPTVEGVASGRWAPFEHAKTETKAELLALWDAQTAPLNELFPKIPPARFSEVDKAFGQWEMPGLTIIQYAIDNEIHHRGEGYVYLRALGIEPPPFWDRA